MKTWNSTVFKYFFRFSKGYVNIDRIKMNSQISALLTLNLSPPPFLPCLQMSCSHPLRKKCPYSELFWFKFSRIWTKYGEILFTQPLLSMARTSWEVKNQLRYYLIGYTCSNFCWTLLFVIWNGCWDFFHFLYDWYFSLTRNL